ncbi:hypothetical protein QH637_07175 [Heyndrickxia coagulans]
MSEILEQESRFFLIDRKGLPDSVRYGFAHIQVSGIKISGRLSHRIPLKTSCLA